MFALRVVVFFFFSGLVEGTFKKWIKDTNFENPNNWNAGRAPCGNDVVNIPDDSPVIYVQINTTLKELILPQNSEIVFGERMTLAFTDQSDASCQSYSGDVEFNVNNPRKWLDPANWCQTDTEQGTCQQAALLDSEKIPCSTDNIVFPRNRLYSIDLGQNLNLKINKLKFSGTSFSTSSFQQYLTSPDGIRLFPPTSGSSRSTVTIARLPSGCNDLTGCSCGNDRGQIFTQLCSIIQNRCERAMCRNPIQPAGSCCRMCGVVFNATIAPASGFRFNEYKNLFQGFVNSRGNSSVSLIASKVGGGFIQMVLTDPNGELSVRVAAYIRDDLNLDQRSGGHKYRIESYRLTTSGSGIPTPTTATTASSTTPSTATTKGSSPTTGSGGSTGASGSSSSSSATQSPLSQTGGKGMSGGSVAGLVIGLLLLFTIIAFIGFYLYRRKMGRPIYAQEYLDAFNPRTLLSRGSQVFRTSGRRQPERTVSDSGFPNPLYGTSEMFSRTEMPPMELMPVEEQPTFDVSDAGFNNPLYGTVGKQEPQYQDPSHIPDDSTI
ncbi:protein amnionless-like [Gigantopelta aegis]|uniref:protein amnionless-like n=1 Tax=Gigantopelta aegis TaxID=1735272 RepID=UPI001B88C060|nr:protein amnionless-like [Gigantopelta aegis]